MRIADEPTRWERCCQILAIPSLTTNNLAHFSFQYPSSVLHSCWMTAKWNECLESVESLYRQSPPIISSAPFICLLGHPMDSYSYDAMKRTRKGTRTRNEERRKLLQYVCGLYFNQTANLCDFFLSVQRDRCPYHDSIFAYTAGLLPNQNLCWNADTLHSLQRTSPRISLAADLQDSLVRQLHGDIRARARKGFCNSIGFDKCAVVCTALYKE